MAVIPCIIIDAALNQMGPSASSNSPLAKRFYGKRYLEEMGEGELRELLTKCISKVQTHIIPQEHLSYSAFFYVPYSFDVLMQIFKRIESQLIIPSGITITMDPDMYPFIREARVNVTKVQKEYTYLINNTNQ